MGKRSIPPSTKPLLTPTSLETTVLRRIFFYKLMHLFARKRLRKLRILSKKWKEIKSQ